MDLVDKEVENKSMATAGLVMIITCLGFYVAEIMICGTKNAGLFCVAALYNAILFTMKGVRLKNKQKLFIGVLWIVLAIGLAVEHIYHLVTTSTIL